MNTITAKKIFLTEHQEDMKEGDYFTLTKFNLPYNGVWYKQSEKIYFTLDLENQSWIKRESKKYFKQGRKL